jgi:hypothetical protein
VCVCVCVCVFVCAFVCAFFFLLGLTIPHADAM